ncbi:MAG: glutamyl-tRNA reductase [Gemmatimonadota bacterium]
MPIAVVGVSHHTAPVEVRERFAFPPHEALRGLQSLRDETGVQEAVLLSTCNRSEIYVYPGWEPEVRAAERLLTRRAGSLDQPATAYLYSRTGDEAVRHLFRVAAGMDSMVLGEAEIQGQVKEAYEMAGGTGVEPPLSGPILTRLFERALGVGGRVRAETRLGEGSASVASVAVDLAGKVFGSLRNRRVLVLGAGSTAELVVEALAREGVEGVVVANRTYDRARELARRLHGDAVRFEQMAQALRTTDIVVASTAAPHPLVTADTVRAAFPDGPTRSLLVIDIAIPRDVDPAVGDEPNVFLYNVDDLRQIVDEALERRREALPRAERLIAEEAHAFREWMASREVVPMIRKLRTHGHRLRREELERLRSSLNHLGDEDLERVEEFGRRLVNKLLHDPTVRLKQAAANGRGPDLVEALRYLYALDGVDDAGVVEEDDANEVGEAAEAGEVGEVGEVGGGGEADGPGQIDDADEEAEGIPEVEAELDEDVDESVEGRTEREPREEASPMTERGRRE